MAASRNRDLEPVEGVSLLQAPLSSRYAVLRLAPDERIKFLSSRSRYFTAASIALTAAACGRSAPSVLDEFESTLASQHSATEALRQWCGRRGLADRPAIAAHPVDSPRLEASADIRDWLDVGEETPVAYRHVELACGDVVMSRARNWYVPSRLTPEMNRALETSDAPFGQVVEPLGFIRRPLAIQRGGASDCPSGTILSHLAVLTLPDGQPISLVVECYTRANLGGG